MTRQVITASKENINLRLVITRKEEEPKAQQPLEIQHARARHPHAAR